MGSWVSDVNSPYPFYPSLPCSLEEYRAPSAKGWGIRYDPFCLHPDHLTGESMMIAGIEIKKIKGCPLPIVVNSFTVLDGSFDSLISENGAGGLGFLDIKKRKLVHLQNNVD
jgi:hypothetical protein